MFLSRAGVFLSATEQAAAFKALNVSCAFMIVYAEYVFKDRLGNLELQRDCCSSICLVVFAV